ncbi:hypothetical protein NQ176_g9034 [Zarea fungicola]|uniref:Uncharacterized protein n=1 Tax=Zarea fungicola TaxID=93591 RepID=A0ACC1MPW3_9HYPO|nr:hypothetical protein NQ176_g9034 [Lecanicillium fungicola]
MRLHLQILRVCRVHLLFNILFEVQHLLFFLLNAHAPNRHLLTLVSLLLRKPPMQLAQVVHAPRLTKVEKGLCGGEIMWHEYINKSKDEIKAMEQRWQKRRQEKEARKKEQKANVDRKKAEKESRRGNRPNGAANDDDGDDDDEDMEDFSDYDYELDGAAAEGDDGESEDDKE